MVCVSVPTAAVVDAAATDAAATAGTAAAADAAGAAGTDLAASAIPAAADAGSSSGIGGLLDSIGSGISSGYNSVANGLGSLFGSASATPAATGAAGDAGAIGGITDTGEILSPQAAAATGDAVPAAGSSGPGVGSYLSKQNPLNLALAGTTGLGAISSLIPKKQVNVGQNAANVMATNPNFSNPNLPQYTMQNTAAPYAGNWYTYGQQPQTAPLYNAQPMPVTPAKTGGLMKGYAQGGTVHGYGNGMPNPLSGAMGGVPMVSNQPIRRFAVGGVVPQGTPMPPQGMSPQMPMSAVAPMQQQVRKPVNPLVLHNIAHKVGMALGKRIAQKHGVTPPGPVSGPGGGHDDLIPARLSDGEFVHSADVVAALGDGSTREGGKKLKAFDAAVRAHKTKNGSKFPPRAKNPLSYLPKGSI